MNPTESYSIEQAWGSIPDVVYNTTLNCMEQKHNDLFQKGKGGDLEAAQQLVAKITNKEKIRQIAQKYPDAVIAPVMSQSTNVIPLAYAMLLSEQTGLPYTTDFRQVKAQHRTGEGSYNRLTRIPAYTGTPEAKDYILVDDHIVIGGTLNALRRHIRDNGGNPVLITTLTVSQFSSKIHLTQETYDKIQAVPGATQLDQDLKELGYKYGIADLTESEARNHILKLQNQYKTMQVAEEMSAISGFSENNQDEDENPPSAETKANSRETAEQFYQRLLKMPVVEQVEEMAALYFSVDDICTLTNLKATDIINDINSDDATEIQKAYRRGVLRTKILLRFDTKRFAVAGSPAAVDEMKEYLSDQIKSEH